MDGFLRVDNATNLPGSPTNSFLADEVASICPLLTPSPPTNDLINPLPESTEPNFAIGEHLATKLKQVQDEDKADSASSSSSVEPARAQLLHRTVFHHMDKDENGEPQETLGKVQILQLTFRNPPDNYFFMSWNWPLIRKVSLWVFMSGLMAMVAVVIAMIYNLPKTCNPVVQWYQGNVFYEIFPASFNRGEIKMEGNFKGITSKTEYIRSLGVRGVRLNSIFTSPHYPKDFDNVTSLINVASELGDLNDFKIMVELMHMKNISVMLDLPIYPFFTKLNHRRQFEVKNESNSEPTSEFLKSNDVEMDAVEESLLHWTTNGVDGFYLKGLENLVEDPNFAHSLRRWKKIIGPDRAFIVSEEVLNKCPAKILNILLNNVDLVDVVLNIQAGATAVNKQIDAVQNGTLFSKPGMPWVHWSLANVNSKRLANMLPYGNGTLGATLLQMMLPGTPSIFYGDEIGLQEISDKEGEKQDIKHLHQLTMMPWPNQTHKTLPWIYGGEQALHFDQVELISKMAAVRMESPSIYMNSVLKEGVSKANAEIKYALKEFLVVQRWYPRRKAYVVACNLGGSKITADLSTILYSGQVVVGPRRDSKASSVSFKEVSLWPGESVVIVLD